MSNINPKTEELIDRLDALYEQEHEARINECPAYAASCRKEIRKIERQFRKAAAAGDRK